MSHTLDPITFPLHGTRLIEASAGTGKTYTIAALYLRLVLGHGGERGFSRALTPPEILVVTFTNAATEELRDRIRRRLTEAAAFFTHPDYDQKRVDDFLKTLRSHYPEESWPLNGRLLENAAQWMDEAAIHTIHSWCQRALRQHAFESGSLFDLKLSVNDDKLFEDAVCDYWRSHFYNRTVEEISELKSMVAISTPQELLKKVMPLIRLNEESAPADSSSEAVSENGSSDVYGNSDSSSDDSGRSAFKIPDPFDLLKERRQLIEAARLTWASDFNSAVALLIRVQADKTLKGNQYSASSLEKWLEELRSWVKENGPFPCEKVIQKFSTTGLNGAVAKNRTAPSHPAFDAFDTLLAQFAKNKYLSSPGTFAYLLYSYAAAEIRKRVDRVKERLALVGFDDMLNRLDGALCRPGDNSLAEVIGNQYPVAMVDEFQDTDSVQYRIFSRIYLNKPGKGFFMIGDPKQAIYAFRGADIYTYLAARRDCQGNLYTLGRNFRSSLAMVEAVNRMFSSAAINPETHPDGPFLFRDKIPFEPVSAHGVDAQFVVHEQEGGRAGITLCHLNQQLPLRKTGREGYIELMAQAFADKIAHLLNLAAHNPPRAGFSLPDLERKELGEEKPPSELSLPEAQPCSGLTVCDDSGFTVCDNKEVPVDKIREIKPLCPSDVAILVRNFHEADAIRSALAMRNLRSVYLSDSDSVFESAEAFSLLYILRGCSEPTNEPFLRAALAAPVLALPLYQLDELNQDEVAWEKQVDRFREYLSIWQHQGVLPMVRALLFDFGIPSRLLSEPSGERKLTNLLHLSEILQRVASNLDGEQALIRWFAKELKEQNSSDGSEERVLRLESDDELIRVVTVHKSKGLEYPLVFLPFICTFREVTALNQVVRYHDRDGALHIVANPEKGDLAAADQERLAEDMRMLYVAVTRSRYACWIGLGVMGRIVAAGGEKSELHRSAPGYLLAGERAILTADLQERLADIKGQCPSIAIESLPLMSRQGSEVERYEQKMSQTRLGPARRFTGEIPSQWWISSYSAILSGAQMPASSHFIESGIGADAQMPSLPLSRELHLIGAGADNSVITAPLSPAHDQLQEYSSEPSSSADINPSERSIHTFPRGAEPGTFLHDLMEWAAREGFDRIRSDHQYLLSKIKLLSSRRGWEEWAEFLTEWLQKVLQIPLPVPPELKSTVSVNQIILSELSSDHCQAEMEFMFAAERVDTTVLDEALHAAILPGMVRPVLKQNRLNGMVKGFIDLLFCYNGQYFVMDYKSNYLGDSIKAYDRNAMNHALLEHRYDLQYLIYTVALHRLLKSRLGSRYDYNKDVGGVIYLFMRGLNLDSPGADGENHGNINSDGLNHKGGNSGAVERGDLNLDGHGVYFDKPPFDLIDMVDKCFSGGR